METGHTRNVAHFNGLNILCISLGGSYNPTNPHIQLADLNTSYGIFDNLVKAVKAPFETWSDAVDARRLGFVECKHIARLSLRALKSSNGVTQGDINRAQSLVDKITGANIQKHRHDPEHPEHHSVSQQSYDQILGHFNELIVVYQQSAYNTNEPGLDIPALQTFAGSLQTLNNTVLSTYNPYKTALVNRDTALYKEGENVVSLWTLVHAIKNYIQGSDAFNQTQKKAAAHFSFTRPAEDKLHF